jgi:hypothetical protein
MTGKARILVMLASIVLLAYSSLAQPSEVAPTSCTNASIKGSFGFILTGADSSGNPYAAVGQLVAGGTGTFTGTETITDDGVIDNNAAVTGTYSLGPRCTGTATITASGGTATNYAIVFDSVAKEIEMVETDPAITRSGYAIAQGAAICSTAGLKGTFGFHGFGHDLAQEHPLAFDGQFSLNGTGTISGTQTVSDNGNYQTAPISGTYSVGSNCQGSVTYQFSGGTIDLNLVVVGAGKIFLIIDTVSGSDATGSAQQ